MTNSPVYVVDDDHSVREALGYMLEGYGFDVNSYDCGESFLKQADLHSPGCVILDSRMPAMSGQEVHQCMQEQRSCLSIIYLTSHGDVPMAVNAFRGGASDFHQKPIKAAELIPSLEKALAASSEKCHQLHIENKFNTLTDRERQVFFLVVDGKLNKQIAAELFVSLRTVEVHRAHVMARMSAESLADLVKMAEALPTFKQ